MSTHPRPSGGPSAGANQPQTRAGPSSAGPPGVRYQAVPVRVYQSGGRLMVAAPVPGLEPQDISVTVMGDTLTIRGELRGPHQDERDLLAAEWAIGPYYRELTLPQPVDGARTNATYGNGVLVLALPKREPGQVGGPGGETAFHLDVIEATRGAHVGHTGREMRETTTAEYRHRLAETARTAGHQRGEPPQGKTVSI